MASANTRSSVLTAVGLPVILFLVVFGVYAGTTERHAVNTDAYAASAGAWRIATAGTPWFDDLDVKRIDGTHGSMDGSSKNGQWLALSPNQHVAAQRMPGPIIAGIPMYWILGEGSDEEDFQLLPGGLAASLLSALVATLLFLAVRARVAPSLALTAAMVFAFATPTWSVSANGLWTHPVTQLGIAGAAYASSKNRWWMAGVFLGLGMFGRPHVALIAAVLGLGLAVSRRAWGPVLGISVPTLAALGLIAAWNRSIHGIWSIRGNYDYIELDRAVGGMGGEQFDNYLGFMFSLDRGFLIWTPIVLLFLPALIRARRVLPDWSIWLAAGGVMYTFFQLRLNHFAGGEGFYSYRHGLELLTCIAPVLIFSAPCLGRLARFLAPLVVALQVAAFTIGAATESYFVPLDDVWTQNSLWMALLHDPKLVGGWLAVALALGLLIAIRYVPKTPAIVPEDDGLVKA